MMNNLLINEPPLQVLPSLVIELGNTDKAIILQQIHYWLQRSNNIVDGHRWIYNSAHEWQKQFPWLTEKTIQRYLKSLVDDGWLISGNYNKAKFDRTKWYRVRYDRLDKNVQALGLSVPTIGPDSTNGMGLSVPTNTNRLPETTTEIDDDDTAKPISKIIGLWQENFGMPNSIIMTDLQEDLNDWGYELLNYAIHRMLESGATYNRPYQYLNKILANYRSYGITTVAKAKQVDEKRDAELATKASGYNKSKPLRRSQQLAKPDRPKDNRPKVSTMYKALTIAYEQSEEEARQHINEMLARGELINDGWNG